MFDGESQRTVYTWERKRKFPGKQNDRLNITVITAGYAESIKGYDYLPDRVMELFDEFDCCFEDELSYNEIDGNENDELNTEEK